MKPPPGNAFFHPTFNPGKYRPVVITSMHINLLRQPVIHRFGQIVSQNQSPPECLKWNRKELHLNSRQ